MKTNSSDYIREIKDGMKAINEALKRVQEAERVQYSAKRVNEYDKAKREAISASADVMVALEEIVRLASAIGCATGLYDINKYHKIVELDFRESHK